LQSLDLPLVIQGKTVGSMKLPAGSEVEVVSNNGTNSVIQRGGSTFTIPACALAAPSPISQPTDQSLPQATHSPAQNNSIPVTVSSKPLPDRPNVPSISTNLSLITVPDPLHCSGREWHVATNGNDNNMGNQSVPFKTIKHALEVARPGDAILLHGGQYREVIEPIHDGESNNPIIIQNARGESPILSAYEIVHGPWKDEGNGVFSSSLEHDLGPVYQKHGTDSTLGYEQVLVDGELYNEARYPKKISKDIMEHESAKLSITSNGQVDLSVFGPKPDNFFAGAKFLGRFGQGWALQSSSVLSSTAQTAQLDLKTASFPWWPKNDDQRPAQGYGFFYGKKEFLDTEGEFYISRGINEKPVLYIKFRGGIPPAARFVEHKASNWLLNTKSNHDIIIRGLKFRGGAIFLDGHDLVFEKCAATNSSHFLAFRSGYDCSGGFPQGTAITVNGYNNTVRDSTICDTAGTGICLKGTNNTASRNDIHNTDYSGTYAASVYLQGMDNKAEFNTIHDTGRDGIKIEGSGHIISYNYVYDVGRQALDLGCIESALSNGKDRLGRNTRICYNWTRSQFNGIYLDEYSQNFLVDHNVVFGGGKHKSIALNAPACGIEFYNNTILMGISIENNSFCNYPLSNPDPSFWSGNRVGLNFIYQNNLFCSNWASVTEFIQSANEKDFRPKGSAIAPQSTNGLIEWTAVDGKEGVPPDFRLGLRDKLAHFLFYFHEITGHGVTISGINDGLKGKNPDDGAYQTGQTYWKPGVDGCKADSDGISK
jgi:hypothetical protein